MADTSLHEEGLLSGTKPRELFLVDLPYRDAESGRLKHAVYLFRTRSKAKEAMAAIEKWAQEGDKEPVMMTTKLEWVEAE